MGPSGGRAPGARGAVGFALVACRGWIGWGPGLSRGSAMGIRRSVARAAILAWISLLGASRAEAEEPAPAIAPTAEAFVAGLAKVRGLLAESKSEPAQALFDKLLLEHRGADHARAK